MNLCTRRANPGDLDHIALPLGSGRPLYRQPSQPLWRPNHLHAEREPYGQNTECRGFQRRDAGPRFYRLATT